MGMTQAFAGPTDFGLPQAHAGLSLPVQRRAVASPQVATRKYGGRIPYEPQGVTMAAYQLTFTFWATLDYPAQSDVVALDVAPG